MYIYIHIFYFEQKLTMRNELHFQTQSGETLRKKAKQEKMRKKAKYIIDNVLWWYTKEELLENFLYNNERIKKAVIDKYNAEDQKWVAWNDVAKLIEIILKTNIEREAECFIENLKWETYKEKLSYFKLIKGNAEIINIYPKIIRNDISNKIEIMLETKIWEEKKEEQRYEDIAKYIIEYELKWRTYFEKLMDFDLIKANGDYWKFYKWEIWDKIANFIERYLIRMMEQENENTSPLPPNESFQEHYHQPYSE